MASLEPANALPERPGVNCDTLSDVLNRVAGGGCRRARGGREGNGTDGSDGDVELSLSIECRMQRTAGDAIAADSGARWSRSR